MSHDRVRSTLDQLTQAPTAALVDRFQPELDRYAELIVGPGRAPVGFMTRGEDADFTARVRATLEGLGMPAAALDHHAALAEWFEHRRAFFKVEWHATDDGFEPLAACYFRRRPRVDDLVLKLARWGIPPAARLAILELAERCEKRTVHFVSAAFRPGRAVYHKAYFSQWVRPDNRDRVSARIERIMARYRLDVPGWKGHHRLMLDPGESTLFVSTSVSAEGPASTFKIDYPEVGAARAAIWLPPAEQAAVIADISEHAPRMGTQDASFLGVRFHPGRATPTLKYYFDAYDRRSPLR